MKLSIITINRNNEYGLRKTIESVVGQINFTDYEFIIIDGNSTDGSVEVINEYKDKITYWISEPDKGIYNAMNKGIRQAKGEYCHFLNSGDLFASHTTLSKIFEGDPHDSFICCPFITEKKGVLADETSNKYRDWKFALYDLFSGFLCHQSFLIRKDNFDKYGLYDENLKVISDWKLFFVAIAINYEPVAYKDVDIVIYNMEGFSTQVGGAIIYKEKLQVCREYLSERLVEKLERLYYLEQNGFVTDIIKSKGWIYFCFRAFCKLGRIFGFAKP